MFNVLASTPIDITLLKKNKTTINTQAGSLNLEFNGTLQDKIKRLSQMLNFAHDVLVTSVLKIMPRLTDKQYTHLEPLIRELENSPSLDAEQKKQTLLVLEQDYLNSQKSAHDVIRQLVGTIVDARNNLYDIRIIEEELLPPHHLTGDIAIELENNTARQGLLNEELNVLTQAIKLIDDKNIADYLSDWIPSEETINAINLKAPAVELLKQALRLTKKYLSFASEHLNYVKLTEARDRIHLDLKHCQERETELKALQKSHHTILASLTEAAALVPLKEAYETQVLAIIRQIENYLDSVNFEGALSSERVNVFRQQMEQLRAYLSPLASIWQTP